MTLTARQQALQRIADTMDQAELRQIERVKAMRARHVTSYRDRHIKSLYGRLLRNTQIETEKLGGLVVMGRSGSGKTHLVRQMEAHPAFQPYEEAGEPLPFLPYITLDAPTEAAPNVLIAEIIKKCGFPVAQPGNVSAMISLAMKWFAKRRVLFVHIDEFQHSLRNGTAKQVQDIQNAIKLLIQVDAPWPVQIILSGTPELADFRGGDDQLRNRTFPYELRSITFNAKEADKIVKIVRGVVTNHAELAVGELEDHVFAHQLLKASNYQFGNVVAITRLACEDVIYSDGHTVGIEQFAKVYSTLVDTLDAEQNMFTSTNWMNLHIPNSIVDGTAFVAKRKKIKTSKVR